MARNLRSNSTAPPIFPIQSDLGPVNLTMAAPNPNPAPPVAQAAPVPVIWAEDPDTDDFNPGTATGQKIFEQRARGHPDGKLFSNSFEDTKEFPTFLHSRSKALGTAATYLPVALDANGNPTVFKNIITQYQSIKLEDVQRKAHKHHSTQLAPNAPIPPQPWVALDIDPANELTHMDIFYNCVRGNVVGKFLDNTLDPLLSTA